MYSTTSLMSLQQGFMQPTTRMYECLLCRLSNSQHHYQLESKCLYQSVKDNCSTWCWSTTVRPRILTLDNSTPSLSDKLQVKPIYIDRISPTKTSQTNVRIRGSIVLDNYKCPLVFISIFYLHICLWFFRLSYITTLT